MYPPAFFASRVSYSLHSSGPSAFLSSSSIWVPKKVRRSERLGRSSGTGDTTKLGRLHSYKFFVFYIHSIDFLLKQFVLRNQGIFGLSLVSLDLTGGIRGVFARRFALETQWRDRLPFRFYQQGFGHHHLQRRVALGFSYPSARRRGVSGLPCYRGLLYAYRSNSKTICHFPIMQRSKRMCMFML